MAYSLLERVTAKVAFVTTLDGSVGDANITEM